MAIDRVAGSAPVVTSQVIIGAQNGLKNTASEMTREGIDPLLAGVRDLMVLTHIPSFYDDWIAPLKT
jgi:hypothetical protein